MSWYPSLSVWFDLPPDTEGKMTKITNNIDNIESWEYFLPFHLGKQDNQNSQVSKKSPSEVQLVNGQEQCLGGIQGQDRLRIDIKSRSKSWKYTNKCMAPWYLLKICNIYIIYIFKIDIIHNNTNTCFKYWTKFTCETIYRFTLMKSACSSK